MNLNIVVLDGEVVNPGDLSWESLESFGEVVVYPNTSPDKIVGRISNADVVLSNKVRLEAEALHAALQLKHIFILATGTEIVDHDAAAEKNISVNAVPGYSTEAVAQHTFALLLAITQQIEPHNLSVHHGDWSRTSNFCYTVSPLIELKDKTFGIIGFGGIGQAAARLANAFGMKVLIHTRRELGELPENQCQTDFESLLKLSDVVSLHCPLTPETDKLINQERLKLFKETAILINTGRGALIDEHALADALNNDNLYAAGLDVLSQEPPPSDHILFSAKNCWITPHIAWAAKATRQRLLDITFENMAKIL